MTTTPRVNASSRVFLRRCAIAIFGCSVILFFYPYLVHAAGAQLISLSPGDSADAYFEANLSGKVYVKIGAKAGDSACAEFWWIKWPLGNVESLGRHCDFAEFEIPGMLGLAISSKLRVGGATNPIKLAVTADEAVAHSVKFDF